MSGSDEVATKVRRVLLECLDVDEEEIMPAATLRGDLGAESIDFLDIVFRLEQEFGITIPHEELFPESIFRGDPKFVRDGRLTPEGLEQLRTRMPFADLGPFEQDPEVGGLSDLFTVGLLARYVRGKLGAGSESG